MERRHSGLCPELPGLPEQCAVKKYGFKKKKTYLLMCTTFAGGNPLKYVDEAWEYAPMFSE